MEWISPVQPSPQISSESAGRWRRDSGAQDDCISRLQVSKRQTLAFQAEEVWRGYPVNLPIYNPRRAGRRSPVALYHTPQHSSAGSQQAPGPDNPSPRYFEPPLWRKPDWGVLLRPPIPARLSPVSVRELSLLCSRKRSFRHSKVGVPPIGQLWVRGAIVSCSYI